MAARSLVCMECGCVCDNCQDETSLLLHLHQEIEDLKQQVLERDHHILKMETNFLIEADKYPNGERAALREEIGLWQEKYERLFEAHKKLQRVNQSLEDKLLKIVDKFETEKSALTRDMSSLTQRLVEARVNINRLQEENERYKNDVNIAIQLLQCKPSNFVSHKLDSLPSDLQQKVKSYINYKKRDNSAQVSKPEMKTIKVPIPTFPPTAMVYSINKVTQDKDKDKEQETEVKNQKNIDLVSAAIMAKVLEEREKERAMQKHCATCKCPMRGKLMSLIDKGTQTLPSYVGERDRNSGSCVYCQGLRNIKTEKSSNFLGSMKLSDSKCSDVKFSSNIGTGQTGKLGGKAVAAIIPVPSGGNYSNTSSAVSIPKHSSNILLDNAYMQSNLHISNGKVYDGITQTAEQGENLSQDENRNKFMEPRKHSQVVATCSQWDRQLKKSGSQSTPSVHSPRSRSESLSSGDSVQGSHHTTKEVRSEVRISRWTRTGSTTSTETQI